MAVIRLGVVVTGVSGSLGGSTFRRYRTGTALQRRSAGGSLIKLMQNNAIARNTTIIQAWSLFTPSEVNAWNVAAPNFPFPDKFGVMRPLSGRELYIKIACYANLLGLALPTPASLSSTVIPIAIELGAFNLSSGSCPIRFADTVAGHYATIQIALIRNINVTLPATRRKVLAVVNIGTTDEIDVYETIINQFPFIAPGQSVQIWATPYNNTSYRGVPVSSKTTCI